ncbi:hypothetical protein CVT24_002906 [Panaeolus cyanescens]|uniref:Uncharacterized protein n=1 Tax=Panaeolus cyanescens TaxID=181874 RepID=A0A409W8L8_9AGAR|nr:hypothetical protein CVT24_002906 [Panaeolus cyanescens]
MRFSILSLGSLFAAVVAQDVSVGQVRKAFDNANIPQDIHITFNPQTLLEVTFPQSGAPPITIHAGEQLPRQDTAGPPLFSLRALSQKQPLEPAHPHAPQQQPLTRGPFVIATVDPDAPTPQSPTVAQIRHFLGGNFFLEGDRLVNRTAAISEFLQPTPPAGSDAHRSVSVLIIIVQRMNG